jgi:hypothetical protein
VCAILPRLDGLYFMQILSLIEQQAREDEAACARGQGGKRRMQKYQGAMTPQLRLGIFAQAIRHLQLADTSRLPVERTTLQALLKRWGGVVHEGSSACPACDQRPVSPPPASIDEPPPPLDSPVLRIRNVELDMNNLNVREIPAEAVRRLCKMRHVPVA